MSDRASQIIQTVGVTILGVALTLMGYFSRSPGFMDNIWWIPLSLGILLIVMGLAGIWFYSSQPDKLPCPYCGEQTIPKRQGFRDHLYLSRSEEDQPETKADDE